MFPPAELGGTSPLHQQSTSTAPAPVSVSALLNLQFSNSTGLLLPLLCYYNASYILKETIVFENQDIYLLIL